MAANPLRTAALPAILVTPMSACGAWPGRCPAADAVRLPTDVGPPPVGQGWSYWALSGTAVAVGQSLEGSIDGSTARTRLEGVPGGRPNRLGTDAYAAERCFTRRASRPPGSGDGARFGRRTVSPRRCASAVMRAGIRP